MNKPNNFENNLSWILKNKLAIGISPMNKADVNLLKKYKIKNILGLCSEKEAEWHKEIEKNFECSRIILPDSNKNRLPSNLEIRNSYKTLKNFLNKNITYIHCFAAIERSPLICIMLIMEEYDLDIEESLDYVKRMHITTNPRNNQLMLIKNYNFKTT